MSETPFAFSPLHSHNGVVVKPAEPCLIRGTCAFEGHGNECIRIIQAYARFRQEIGRRGGGREFESLGVLKREHMRKWSASAVGANKG